MLLCKAVTKPCVREIVCKEIIVDRDKLSDQLNNSRKECLDDKSEFGKSLKVRLTNDCNNRVKDAIKNIGAKNLKDMGKTMGYLKEQYPGQIDFSKASIVVREILEN